MLLISALNRRLSSGIWFIQDKFAFTGNLIIKTGHTVRTKRRLQSSKKCRLHTKCKMQPRHKMQTEFKMETDKKNCSSEKW